MLGIMVKKGHRPDMILVGIVVILVIAGIAILASASSDLGSSKFNDSYYFLKHQLLYGLSLGTIACLIAYIVPYHLYRRLALPIAIGSIILLALVFTHVGLNIRNTNRWIALGGFSFQPAEIAKFAYILYLAAWLSNTKAKRETAIGGFIPFLATSTVFAGLLLAQPATSTVAIMLASGMAVYFVSGASWRYIGATVLFGVAVFSVVIYVTPYRLARITSYLHSNKDTQGSSYHLNQALIAIGSGRTFGVGYGQSTSKVTYLPTPIDDSIFAVAAEELGFVGAAAIITLFALLTLRMFLLARLIRDRFGKLLLIGFGSLIGLQAIVHICSISGILPLTGVPLPFISYGGTALAIFLAITGITVNISRYT